VAADEPLPQTVEAIAVALPASAWQRLAFRNGTKGVQYAHFARRRVVAERDDLPGPELWLVIERSCQQQPEVKYYLSNALPDCPLATLVRIGHTRWPIEDCFLRGKDELGLADYEVTGWRGWHHHQTLVLLAMWFLLLQARRLGEKNHGRSDRAGHASAAAGGAGGGRGGRPGRARHRPVGVAPGTQPGGAEEPRPDAGQGSEKAVA